MIEDVLPTKQLKRELLNCAILEQTPVQQFLPN